MADRCYGAQLCMRNNRYGKWCYACLLYTSCITTQFTMTTLEELGLLKMYFLGLRTLTVIQNGVKLIKKDKDISLDIDNIDFNDKAVLDLSLIHIYYRGS